MVLISSSNDAQAFIQANQQTLAELLTFLDFADEKLTLSFIEINFESDKKLLIEILKNHPDCQNVEFLILKFADPELRFLQDSLITQLKAFTPNPQKKLVVMLLGLEHSIGMTGSYPPMLQDLNFIRDSLINTVPYPLLLVLPDYSLTRVAKYAPDFWAWRYMIFRFKTTAQVKEQAIDQTLQNSRILGNYTLPEKRERIDLLERLLMEYCPSGKVLTEENHIPYVQVLLDLGICYRSHGVWDKAKGLLKEALSLTENQEKLEGLQANILHELASIYANQGQIDRAITLYQQSLELTEKIGDVQGKAAILHQLAIIYANQGQIDRAITLYQQSLELTEKIGDVQGKAATLHQLAIIYADQGKIDQAIAFFLQSLEIKEKIGNVQGKAATLHQLAIIYADQGKIDQAIALFLQSLELKEKIGDVQGKAMTLWWLGGLANDGQGNSEQALIYLQEAFEILQRLRPPDAVKVQNMIARIRG